MGRSGLTKSQVRAIRKQLQAEGRYPSVDAVRHALGDTGSKSTIHKYLKELAEEDTDAGGGREATGRTLLTVVEQLADQLHLEAERRMRSLLEERDRQLREKERELAELRRTVAALTARVEMLEEEAVPVLPRPGRFSDGFGQFDGLLLNSRCGGRDSSPFSMVRGAARSEAFDAGSAWPV